MTTSNNFHKMSGGRRTKSTRRAESMMSTAQTPVENGDLCTVTAGVHKGKAGIVEDLNMSKGGNLTITVRQADGDRFKTLAKNVVKPH